MNRVRSVGAHWNVWVSRRAGVVLVVVLGVFGTMTVHADQAADNDRAAAAEQRAEDRDEARAEAARNYVLTLRAACGDRNVRDGKILAGIRIVADALEAEPETIRPLAEALAPRNCEAIYPMPDAKGKAPSASPDTTLPAQPFDSCRTAKAAGMTPLRRGDPGYSVDLDRDGDGIACE